METLMGAVRWLLHDIELGESADPAADQVVARNFAPVTTTEQTKATVWTRMHSHFVSRASVQGVRIVDGNGTIIVRWTYWDEMRGVGVQWRVGSV